MLDFNQLCNDYHIPYAEIGNKHYTEGWINVSCPFCGGHSYHLGFNTNFNYFNCWKCGHHSVLQTIQKLLNLSYEEVKRLLAQYEISGKHDFTKIEKVKASVCNLPIATTDLQPQHIKYLEKRGFNAQSLADEWGIKGTIGFGGYANRIIIPIEYYGTLCSYQGRDITGKAELRYKACKSTEEVIDHQHIVYGIDKAIPFNQCVVVEGVFDAWKLGAGAVSCFGIDYTAYQVRCLARHF